MNKNSTLTWQERTAYCDGKVIGWFVTRTSGSEYGVVFCPEQTPVEESVTSEAQARSLIEKLFANYKEKL